LLPGKKVTEAKMEKVMDVLNIMTTSFEEK
jgi:hypothetical protein